jgi:hypothetical protein
MRTARNVVGALALALMVLSTAAFAQPLPHENHYKVYRSSPISLSKDVELSDQFGKLTVNNLVFDRFSTPAVKIHQGQTYPMVDPLIHLDWWRIFYPQPPRNVIVTDQFGQKQWTVGAARYLLLPALKNPQSPPPPTVPTWNHYLCYEVLGAQDVNQPVTLIDQFGTVQVFVRRPVFLCNPVAKRVFTATGPVEYPIIDATAHLAVYAFDRFGLNQSITAYDQFGFWQTPLFETDLLCVPALKDHPVPTTPSTWGKIKSLYRS